MIRIFLLCIAFLGVASAALHAQSPSSDNEDGTFTNPVLRYDAPDPDVIRVGKDYYFVSSSFHLVPGDPILHSTDLIHWQVISYAIPTYDPTLCGRRYDMEGGNAYAFGSWAPSLGYHDGVFYVGYWLRDFDAKGLERGAFYVSRATDPRGPWVINKIEANLYDPGLFFDDDGRAYVVHGQGKLYCTELTADLKAIQSPARLIFDANEKRIRGAVEGAHVYKRDGFYYIFTPCGSASPVRWGQLALRSRSIYGPYESKIVFEDALNWPNSGPHQGALVETSGGEWWAILFQGRGRFGRIPVMLPVKWEDGWPMLQAGVTFPKPRVGTTQPSMMTSRSDEFDSNTLGLQWQWNHNPDDAAWSLRERPGWLRLRTGNVAPLWAEARNTLTQPAVFGTSVVTAKLDISRMLDGDIAGIGVMQLGSSYIAVTRADGKRILIVGDEIYELSSPGRKQRSTLTSEPLGADVVYLRATRTDPEHRVQYACSIDGQTFQPLGEPVDIEFILNRRWIGMRFGVFNYATRQRGGQVDVDFVHYDVSDTRHHFRLGQTVEAERYDADQNTTVQMSKDDRADGFDAAVLADDAEAWIRFDSVDFADGAQACEVRVLPGSEESRLSIRIDAPNGQEIGSIVIPASADRERYITLRSAIANAAGRHAVFVRFPAPTPEPARLNWLRFSGVANR